jgi:cardiolipin synthase
VLYLTFGARKVRRRLERHARVDKAPAASGLMPPVDALDRIARSHGLDGATDGNRVTLCGTPDSSYEAVLETIARARETLGVSMYILGKDEVAAEIIRRLADRAASGVDVRLLIDDVGSRDIGEAEVAPLTKAGGRVARFMPVSYLPRPRSYANLRNHRKIIVADRDVVWSGGMNLSELYLGPNHVEDRFRDLSFVIEGPAAASYAEILAADWLYTTGDPFPKCGPVPPSDAPGTVVQVVPSGPAMDGDTIYDILVTMAYQAQRRLWAVTPYFVPDRALMQAFALAAMRGVDVRVITPRVSDHRLLDIANVPYLRSLEAAGGTVLRLGEGMIHAKAVVVDDGLALAGTANLDQRSLFLNYEVMALFRGERDVRAIADWIERLFPACQSRLPEASQGRQLMEGLVRLIAPVL